MTKIFYPKIVFPLINLILIIFFLSIGIFMFQNIQLNNFIKFDFWFYLIGIFFTLFYLTVVFCISYQFVFYFKIIFISNDKFKIFELKKMNISNYSFSDIQGFSRSESYFGNKIKWKTKSIVIYFKNGENSELLNNFIFSLDILEKELKKNKIKYLGFEPYQTGWYFRKYKFYQNNGSF